MKDNLTLWQEKYPHYEAHTPHLNSELDTMEHWSGCPICGEGRDRVSIFEGSRDMVAICRGANQGRKGCGHKFYRKDFGAGRGTSIRISKTKEPIKPQSFSEEYLNNFHKSIFEDKYKCVLDYALKRGLNANIIKKFKLGATLYKEEYGLVFPIPYVSGFYMQTRLIHSMSGNKYINPIGSRPIAGHIKQGSKIVVITEGVVDAYLFADSFSCDVIIMLGKRKATEIAPLCKEYEKVFFASDSDFENMEAFIEILWKLTKKDISLANAEAVGTKDFAEYYALNGRQAFIGLFKDYLYIDTVTVQEVEKVDTKPFKNASEGSAKEPDERIEEYYIVTVEKAKEFIEKFKEAPTIAVDTETMPLPEYINNKNAGLVVGKNKIRLLQLYSPKVGVAVFDMMYIKDFSIFKFLEKKKVIFHNSLFDKQLLAREHVYTEDFFDTMIYAGVVLPPQLKRNMEFSEENKHLKSILINRNRGLKDLTILCLNKEKYGEFHTGWDKPQLPERKILYAKKDAENTYEVAEYLKGNYPADMLDFYKFFMGAFPIVFDCYSSGVKININKLIGLVKKKEATLDEINKKLGFNMNSSLQVDEFFKKKYPAIYKKAISQGITTEKGNKLSLGEKTLNDFLLLLSEETSLKDLINQYKQNKGSLSNLKQYMEYCSPDNRIRSSLMLAGAVTGRFTSGKPNIQNIKNDKEGEDSLRELFLADEGRSFILADYAQQEVRIFALLANDKQLIKAIDERLDIHGFISSKAFDVEYKGKATEHRKTAKAITFGMLYGEGIKSLSKDLTITQSEAKELREKLLKVFPSLSELRSKLERKWNKEKKIYIPYTNGKNRYLYDPEKYSSAHVLVNYYVQGAGASVMIESMSLWNKKYGILKDCKIANTIHDELIFSVKKEQEKLWIPRITNVMEQAFINILSEGSRWKGSLLDVSVSDSFSKK